MNEIKERINEFFKTLKLSNDLKDHPAFDDYIKNITQKILQACINNPDKISVVSSMEDAKKGLIKFSTEIEICEGTEENKKIINTKKQIKYEIKIKSDSEKKLSCVIEEKQPEQRNRTGKMKKQVYATEETIEIDTENKVCITSIHSEANTEKCDIGYDDFSGVEKRYYDANGIMQTRIIDQYRTHSDVDIDQITSQNMIYKTIKLFESQQKPQSFSRTIIQRNKNIDMRLANISSYYLKGAELITKNTVAILDLNRGLQNLFPLHQVDENTIEQELNAEELEKIIEQETNEKIKKGLKDIYGKQIEIKTK